MLRRTPIRKKPRPAKTSWRNPERVRLDSKDMAKLRSIVFRRARGRCENLLDARRCPNRISWWDGEMHHVLHRSCGGPDSQENCLALCWDCHRAHHDGKLRIEPWWKKAA